MTTAFPPWDRLAVSSAFETVDLSSATCIAAGSERDVYLHPADPGLLIKVNNQRRMREVPALRRWWTPFQRAHAYRVLLSEIAEWVASAASGHAGDDPLMARVVGVVPTTHGLGEVVEKIADSRGGVAPTLHQVIEQGGYTDELRGRLDAFFHDLAESHVVFNDVSSHNIVLGRNAQGREGLYLIDGYGSRQMLPVYAWSKWLNRKRLYRKYADLRGKLRLQAAMAPAHAAA